MNWLVPHRGRCPELRWQFRPDALLTDAAFARESGETFVLDAGGDLYRVGRDGSLLGVNRLREPLTRIAWSDAGTLGAAVSGDRKLMVFDESLAVLWETTAPDSITGLAVDPYGGYVAASLDDRGSIIMSRHRKKVASFETIRPLVHLAFLASEPILVAAAEQGLMVGYSLGGERLWSEKVLSGVGSLAVAGDGSRIVLAGFTHGVPVHDEVGDALGSMMVDGTAVKAAIDIDSSRILVATLEQALYWVDADGDVLWVGQTPEPTLAMAVDPFGEFIQPAFAGDGVVRLHWDR